MIEPQVSAGTTYGEGPAATLYPASRPDRFAQALIAGGTAVERYGLRLLAGLAVLLVLMAIFRAPGQWPLVGVLSVWFWGALVLSAGARH